MAFSKEEYLQLRNKRLAKAETKSDGFDSSAYLDLRAKRLAEQQAVEEENKRTWFQKGSDNVGKAIFGSGADVVENLLAGLSGIGEKVIDAGATLAPYLAHGVAQSMGGSAPVNINQQQAENQMLQSNKNLVSGFVEKDLYDEKALAQKVVSDPLKKLTGIDTKTDSIFGDKTDALVQSGGQLLGTAALGATGVPWWMISGASALGSEAETALKSGATLDEAALSGAISAGAEILTEKISGGIKFGGKTLDDAITKKLASGISNKAVRSLAKLGIDMAGEGGEEILSGAISKFGQWLTYQDDQTLGQMLFSEEALDEALESFIGGAVMGGVGSVVQGVKAQSQSNDNMTGEKAEDVKTLPQAAQQTAEGGKLEINELVDEVIAKNTGAPADPVGAAVESFTSTGTVSNKQATDILNSVKAVQQLVQETGVKLDGLTMSQRRNAVKSAVEQLARLQTEAAQSQPMNADASVIEQVRSNLSLLNNLEPVAEIQAPKEFSQMNISEKMNWVIEKLRPTNFKVDRKGFGVINFTKKQIKSAFNYFTKGSAEEASFEAIPYVLQYGTEISSRENHKGRGYGTVTFAAPVTINGKRGNMAVVVKQTTDNFYKVHRIITPDGSVFQLTETAEAEPTPAGESPKTGSLATPISSASTETGVLGSSEAGHRQIQTLIPDSNTIIPNDSETVNTENGAVGAAEKGFSPKYALIDKYGAIPEGENPTRVDQLPKSTTGYDRVSYSARTAMEAKVTPDEFVPLIENETMKGGFSFIPLKNTDIVQEAEAAITKAGWDDAKTDWTAAVRAGKSSPQLTAVGALLYNNAVNSGDYKAAMNILSDYQLSVRNSAQALQAARILKTLTPENRLYMIQKSVEQMVEDMHLDTEITIDEDLQDEYVNAETEEARDEVITKIQQHVADQIPSTFMEKWTALRYVNMLGNLRTQVRNVTGNLGMKAVSSAKNAVAAAIESVAHKVSGGKFRRTKSLTVSKDLLNAARSDFSEVESMILGGGKYSDSRSESTEFARGVKDKQTVFKLKPLEGYRKLTNWAMEQGDLVFSRSAYARALAGYLKANGVTGSDLSSVDPALLDDARLYAVQEAQEQTFRDTNWLSGWVSKIGRRKDTLSAAKVLSEGVMPFRKTPANVLVRAEEYSPLGVINSVVTSINALRNGSDVTGAQVVNSWAKSLTGTGIFGLGMLLQSLGLLSAGPDADEDKDSFESMNSWQNYALTLPDGTNLTIDFLTPSAIPLLMGAELMQLMQDGNISVKDMESALTSLADPMVEMSMLQGVNDILENVRYAENNLGQIVVSSALSYLTQVLTNTLAGQLERTFEDSRMQTFVDKDNPLPDWLQRTLGKASAKTPGLDFSQIPYINAWGEEEENPDTGLNGLYNLLSPSYIEKGVSTELTQELNRLNSAQNDINVYPSIPDKTVTFSGQDYNLSADEYVSLAKLQGQTQKQLVEDLISHEVYDSLSDSDKAKAIRYAYDYARDSARGDVVPDHPGITTKWMAELEGDIAEGILRKISAGTTEKYTDLSIEKASFVTELLDSILPPAGKSGVTQQQKVQAVTSADSELSDKEQQQVLKEVLSESAYGKYLEILELGYSNDDYPDSYRIYATEKDIGGKGTKARTIEAFRKEFGISQSAATALYEIYNPK